MTIGVAVLLVVAGLILIGCGGDQDGHVSGDELPLVDGASIAKSRESPAVTMDIRRLLVQGPPEISSRQLKHEEKALLVSEDWHLNEHSHARFKEVMGKSPDDEVGVDFVAAHYPKYARASGYKYNWTRETRELRRAGIPTLFVFLSPVDESY